MPISIQQISYIHPDKEVLFSDLNFAISKGQKLGLVGNNGCGKSTLLQIIAGQLSPSSGVIVRPDDIYYIPQHFGQYDSLTIAQALRIDRKQQALQAILAGDASTENFNQLDDDWNIEERSVAALDSWGLGQFPLSYPMHLLSGGEKTRVFLAGMDIHNPSVILMDEPTNHLDSSGRQRLYDWVEKCHSTLLVVSHDRTLLNLLPEICELEKHQLTYYGGNYEFYKEQKTLMQEALQQRIEEKEKALRIARKVARETAERRDKQNVRGEKANIKRGVPRIVLNALQGKSEKSTGKLNSVHQEKADKLTEERNQLRGSLSPTAALKTDFNGSSLHTGKTLITAKDINFGYHSAPNDSDSQSDNEPSENNLPEQLLWQTPVSFQLKSGDRLRIEGTNGSGKTTLLHVLTGVDTPDDGEIVIGGETFSQLTEEEKAFFRRKHMGMIFQDFQLLESLTVKENILLPLILERKEADIQQERFSRIAYVLGIEKLADKGITEISGGQKQRVAIGRALINEPDIIFGDEPTGSLDRKTTGDVMRCMKQMNQRSGISFLLVTHDAYTASFCDRVLFLQDGNLAKEVKKENTADNFREDIWKTLCGLGGGKDDLF